MWMGSFGFKWLSLNQRSFKRIIVIFVKIVYISLDSDSCLQPKSYPLHLFWINISISENIVSISAGPRSPSSSTASKTKFKTLTKGGDDLARVKWVGWKGVSGMVESLNNIWGRTGKMKYVVLSFKNNNKRFIHPPTEPISYFTVKFLVQKLFIAK